MRLMIAMIAVGLCLPACTSGQPEDEDNAAGPAGILIRDVMVASPERDAAYGPVSVRIAGDAIVGIGDGLRPRRGDTVVEAAGRYLSPGLIDSHAHVGDIPGLRPEDEQAHPGLVEAARAQIPRSYLFHGYTTVIALGSGKAPVEAWNAQALRPQAYFCGAAPVLDGYPTNYAPAPQRYAMAPDYLHDPSRSEPLPPGADPAQHTPEAVAARIADAGARCVKTYYETGFGQDRNLPVPGPGLMQALVAAAHARGLPVFLHANSQRAQAFGLANGADAFAHGMWHWDDADATEVGDALAEQLDRTVAAGIALQPTLQVLYGEGELLDPAFLQRPGLADVYPQELLDFYATAEGQWFRDILAQHVYASGWTPDSPVVLRAKNALRHFAGRGGRLLFGTDTPSAPTYANPPGLNGRWEMDRWIESGIAPREVFRAATLANAAFFGLDDTIGSIAVGKQADLLLLGADPFQSVEAFDRIDTVFVDGRAVPRAELSARR
jgi:imidazolonepropionase-like amidohydrolase